jgi:hypothetical protein
MSGFFQTPPPITLTAKDPFDAGPWKADFSSVLPVGDTIATINDVTATPSDLVVGATAILPGAGGPSLAVGIQLSGGSVNNLYTVTTQITSVAGVKKSRSFILPERTL